MDDSPVQTALCLIGHTIGGNPTQFVVTRVLASMQLDWQFLSFDVEPGQFAKAIAGIDALGFFGAMIAAPYRTEVASVLAHHYGEPDDAVEGINDLIVRGLDGKFVAVNLLAAALTQALDAHKQINDLSVEQLLCVTDDESNTSLLQQFEGALPDKQFIVRGTQVVRWPIAALTDEPVISQAVQSAEVTTSTDTSDADTSDADSKATGEASPEPSDSVADATPSDPHAFDGQQATLVIWDVASKPARKVTQIGSASVEGLKELITRLPMGSVLVDLSCNFDTWVGRQETSMVHPISGVDLKLRRLALAIQRWTGREPNVEIMREAIEEYLEI